MVSVALLPWWSQPPFAGGLASQNVTEGLLWGAGMVHCGIAATFACVYTLLGLPCEDSCCMLSEASRSVISCLQQFWKW